MPGLLQEIAQVRVAHILSPVLVIQPKDLYDLSLFHQSQVLIVVKKGVSTGVCLNCQQKFFAIENKILNCQRFASFPLQVSQERRNVFLFFVLDSSDEESIVGVV